MEKAVDLWAQIAKLGLHGHVFLLC